MINSARRALRVPDLPGMNRLRSNYRLLRTRRRIRRMAGTAQVPRQPPTHPVGGNAFYPLDRGLASSFRLAAELVRGVPVWRAHLPDDRISVEENLHELVTRLAAATASMR